MNLFLNGQKREVEAGTVTDLINELGLTPEAVLVERNGTALLRSEWPQTPLADDDRLEVLRVAAGG
ncbi:MAG: sulfur carrier protein ThiS [Terrimicrobiaceae bacterium]|jgi:sulfur carrier protein